MLATWLGCSTVRRRVLASIGASSPTETYWLSPEREGGADGERAAPVHQDAAWNAAVHDEGSLPKPRRNYYTIRNVRYVAPCVRTSGARCRASSTTRARRDRHSH